MCRMPMNGSPPSKIPMNGFVPLNLERKSAPLIVCCSFVCTVFFFIHSFIHFSCVFIVFSFTTKGASRREGAHYAKYGNAFERQRPHEVCDDDAGQAATRCQRTAARSPGRIHLDDTEQQASGVSSGPCQGHPFFRGGRRKRTRLCRRPNRLSEGNENSTKPRGQNIETDLTFRR
jgi:hypothetical protein